MIKFVTRALCFYVTLSLLYNLVLVFSVFLVVTMSRLVGCGARNAHGNYFVTNGI